MQVYGVAQSKPVTQRQSFTAHVPKALHDELFYAAYKRGHEACDSFWKQAKKVKEWGHETCAIKKVSERTRKGREESLVLIDSYVAPFQEAKLPKKPTLLDSFLALTERVVVDAENTFKL